MPFTKEEIAAINDASYRYEAGVAPDAELTPKERAEMEQYARSVQEARNAESAMSEIAERVGRAAMAAHCYRRAEIPPENLQKLNAVVAEESFAWGLLSSAARQLITPLNIPENKRKSVSELNQEIQTKPLAKPLANQLLDKRRTKKGD